jgi:hypothetical protein
MAMLVQTRPPSVVSGSGGKHIFFRRPPLLPEAGDQLKFFTLILKDLISVAEYLWSGLKGLTRTVDE